jgi:hypothetical protein
MRDEDYDYFINKFGNPTDSRPVPDGSVERFRGLVHDKIIEYWKLEGWCQFQSGLYWSINPAEWQFVVDAWLRDTPYEAMGKYYAIARDAFGKISLYNPTVGATVKIVPVLSMVRSFRLEPLDEKMLAITATDIFSGASPESCDCKDAAGKLLYKRALGKLGALGWDEMYAFEPAVVAGGKMLLENLRKVRWDVHLIMLRELAAPHIPWLDMGRSLRLHNVDIE